MRKCMIMIVIFIFVTVAGILLWKYDYQRDVQYECPETYYNFQDDSISEIQKKIIDAFFRNKDGFVVQDLDDQIITEQFFLDNIAHYKNGDYELIRKYMWEHVKSINFEPDVIFKQQQE